LGFLAEQVRKRTSYAGKMWRSLAKKKIPGSLGAMPGMGAASKGETKRTYCACTASGLAVELPGFPIAELFIGLVLADAVRILDLA
jgi:hypothetical protein